MKSPIITELSNQQIVKFYYRFILLALLFFIADFIIDNVNHRFVQGDFRVYYEAAGALLQGKQVYGIVFSLGSGYYKYSPFSALLASPFIIFPYYFACVLQCICIAAATISTCIIVLYFFEANPDSYRDEKPLRSPNLLLSLSFFCIVLHLIREFGLGNINMILLFLLCLSLLFITQNKFIPTGILLALVIITKPFFILVLLPILLRRYYKIIATVIISLSCFVLLPALITGFNKDFILHKEWINTMLEHSAGFPSPNTLDAIIRNTTTYPITVNLQIIIVLAVLTIFILLTYKKVVSRKSKVVSQKSSPTINISQLTTYDLRLMTHQGLIMEIFILIALMPSIVRTDTEHFLFTLPLIIFLLYYLFTHKSIILTIVFIALIAMYEGNSSDILGHELSIKMYDLGLLGISNILIVGMAIYVYSKRVTFTR